MNQLLAGGPVQKAENKKKRLYENLFSSIYLNPAEVAYSFSDACYANSGDRQEVAAISDNLLTTKTKPKMSVKKS
jgi:hypothetical protein